MFSIRCTTCHAKLAVKNEDAIGQILACPKCGGMVLVAKPDDSLSSDSGSVSADSVAATGLTPPKSTDGEEPIDLIDKALAERNREPESLLSDLPADHGILSRDLPLENSAAKISPAGSPVPPPLPTQATSTLSESELKTRKILIGILVGLLLFLFVSLGVLLAVKRDRAPVEKSIAEEESGEVEPRADLPAADIQSKIKPEVKPQVPPEVTPEIATSETAKPDVLEPKSELSEAKRQSGISQTDLPKNRDDLQNVPQTTVPPVDVASQPIEESKSEKSKVVDLTGSPTSSKETTSTQSPEKSPVSSSSEKQPELSGKEESDPEHPKIEIRSATDLLADMEKKLPGLVEPSAVFSLDISTRLGLPIVGLKLDKTPFLEAIRMISTLTEIPISLDIDEFRCRGIDVLAPMTKQFGTGTAGDVLQGIAAEFQLEPIIEDRQMTITVPKERRDKLIEKTFDISDLVDGSKDAVDLRGKPDPDGVLTPQRLAETVRRLVDPIGFGPEKSEQGLHVEADRPSLRNEGNTLVVRHRLRRLDDTLRLLEQLRVVRGLKQTTEVLGEALAPEAFGWDAVLRPITVHFFQPTPLSAVFSQLEKKTSLKILVDHQALHRTLSPFHSIKGTVRCEKGTLNEALEKLLASVDVASLTYRIVGPDLLETTTVAAAGTPDKMTVEIHRFELPDHLLANDESPEDLVKAIRLALEPNSWARPEDPETLGGGDIVIDRPSGCLIVRQSQPVQRLLRLWLGKKLAQ